MFNYIEPYLAFIMATSIIFAASARYPIYLLPVNFGVIIFFLYLVYNQGDKSTIFLIVIFALLTLLFIFLFLLAI